MSEADVNGDTEVESPVVPEWRAPEGSAEYADLTEVDWGDADPPGYVLMPRANHLGKRKYHEPVEPGSMTSRCEERFGRTAQGGLRDRSRVGIVGHYGLCTDCRDDAEELRSNQGGGVRDLALALGDADDIDEIQEKLDERRDEREANANKRAGGEA